MQNKITIILLLLLGLVFRSVAAEPDNENYRQAKEAYLNEWDNTSALNYLITADKECPENAYIYLWVAKLYEITDPKKADDILQKALYLSKKENDPNLTADIYLQAQSNINFNYSINEADKPVLCLQAFDNAIKAAPNYSMAHYKRGVYNFLTLNNYAEAEKDFLKALSLNPQDIDVYNKLMHLYQTTNNIDKIEWTYRQGIKNIRDYPYYYAELSQLLINKGKVVDAREVIMQGIMLAADVGAEGVYTSGMFAISNFPKADIDWFEKEFERLKKLVPTILIGRSISTIFTKTDKNNR